MKTNINRWAKDDEMIIVLVFIWRRFANIQILYFIRFS